MQPINVVDFRTSPYFPGSIIFLGVLLPLPGLFIASINILAALPFLFVSLIIFTTHNRLEVDSKNKVYRHYVWLLGLKRGESEAYENMEYLFIKKAKVQQEVHSRVTSMTLHSEVYEGFLRFSETDKIHLITSSKKAILINKLKIIASQLNVQILDYSEGTPVAI